MRFVGLVDDAGVYTTWRVPNPTAPYPQDYIIDQQGVVQYWSDQFDPQAVIRTIDRLLASGLEDAPSAIRHSPFSIIPNPARGSTALHWTSGPLGDSPTFLSISDVSGRILQTATCKPQLAVALDLRSLPPGVYMVKLTAGRSSVTQKLVLSD
jgi:hypothetical protein